MKDLVAGDRLTVMKLLLSARCHPHFISGLCVCVRACMHICDPLISRFYLTELPGPTVLLLEIEGVQCRQDRGLLAAVMLSWQRKEEWHAKNCERSVRCEAALGEGGQSLPCLFMFTESSTYLFA